MNRHVISSVLTTTLLCIAAVATGEEAPPTLEQGRQQYEEADFEVAAVTFSGVLEIEGVDEPTSSEAHRYLAALQMIMGQPDDAQQHIDAALAIDREATAPEGAPPELAEAFDRTRADLPASAEPDPLEGDGDGDDDGDDDTNGEGFTDRWVTLGLGVGVYVPTIANDMLPHVTIGLDVGVQLPFHDRRLSIVVGGAWSPPGGSEQGTDPRLGVEGAEWDWDMTTHEVFLSLGAVYRILPPGTSVIVPYVGLVARLYLLHTTVTGTGNDGFPLGEHTEHSTNFGGALLVGGEVPLGSGALFFDLAFGISDLPHRITGDTSTSALAVDVGYRLFL